MTFNQRCYELLSQIPKGKIVTYKQIANTLNTKAYRAVGNAMANNPNPITVPCHRVIKSNGLIGGYAFGVNIKQNMSSFSKKKKSNLISEFNSSLKLQTSFN